VVSGPLPLRPASTSACTTQRRSAVSVRSSSRASVLTLFPLSRTTLIASALNSGENDRRRRFFPMTHSYCTFRAVRSVYETRGSPTSLISNEAPSKPVPADPILLSHYIGKTVLAGARELE